MPESKNSISIESLKLKKSRFVEPEIVIDISNQRKINYKTKILVTFNYLFFSSAN